MTMESPAISTLKVGDFIRFVSVPDEWQDGTVSTTEQDRMLMDYLIFERECLEIVVIDADGTPRTTFMRGTTHHSWHLTERSGWVKLPPLQADLAR